MNLKKIIKILRLKDYSKIRYFKLKKDTLEFLNWFSNYNIVPKGMALKLVLLSGKPVRLLEKNFIKILI